MVLATVLRKQTKAVNYKSNTNNKTKYIAKKSTLEIKSSFNIL